MEDFDFNNFMFGFFAGTYGIMTLYYLGKCVDFIEERMNQDKREKFNKAIIKQYEPK